MLHLRREIVYSAYFPVFAKLIKRIYGVLNDNYKVLETLGVLFESLGTQRYEYFNCFSSSFTLLDR